MKAIKVKDTITICFDNEDVLADIPYNEENWEFIRQNQNDDRKVYQHFVKGNDAYIDVSEVAGSNLLVYTAGVVTMPLVSEISMPKDIIFKVLEAERSGDPVQINKWVNFWTFVSMNPNEAVRDNIFWFLKRWDIQITDSGLIRAYRNVDVYKEANSRYTTEFVKNIINTYYTSKYVDNVDPEGVFINGDTKSVAFYYDDIMNKCNDTPIYTDHHSHTFRIKLGEPVRMPREETDQDSTISCSRGSMCGPVNW